MPLWARVAAATIGVPLLAAGILALVYLRPMETEVILGSIAATMAGTTLVIAAITGRWPSDPFPF